jgi:hypothetical protein
MRQGVSIQRAAMRETQNQYIYLTLILLIEGIEDENGLFPRGGGGAPREDPENKVKLSFAGDLSGVPSVSNSSLKELRMRTDVSPEGGSPAWESWKWGKTFFREGSIGVPSLSISSPKEMKMLKKPSSGKGLWKLPERRKMR